MRLAPIILLLLLCGCAVPRVHDDLEHRSGNSCSRVIKKEFTSPAIPIAGRGPVQAGPASLGEPKPYFLTWGNNNHPSVAPYLLCEIHSTTNLLQPFTLYATVPPTTNALPFWPTNQQRFFIARFTQTNTVPWIYSEWSSE